MWAMGYVGNILYVHEIYLWSNHMTLVLSYKLMIQQQAAIWTF